VKCFRASSRGFAASRAMPPFFITSVLHTRAPRALSRHTAHGASHEKRETTMRELNMAELETVEGAGLARLAWKAAKAAGVVLLELLDSDEAQ
jgi:hypothetical protein